MIRHPFPPLSSNGLSYLYDTEKAGCINYFFTFCFNKSVQLQSSFNSSYIFPATVHFSTLKIMLCLSFLTFLVLMAFLMDAQIHLLFHCLSFLPHIQPLSIFKSCSTGMENRFCSSHPQIFSCIFFPF